METTLVNEWYFYGIMWVVAVLGHVFHWLKKRHTESNGKNFKEHFVNNIETTVMCLFATGWAVYTGLDVIAVGVSMKSSIIAAAGIGWASDSAFNNINNR